MLKLTMRLGSVARLPGENNLAKSIEVVRIVDGAVLCGAAIGERVLLTSNLEGYPYAGGPRYGDVGRKP